MYLQILVCVTILAKSHVNTDPYIFVAGDDIGKSGLIIATIYLVPAMCQALVAEALYTLFHFVFMTTI